MYVYQVISPNQVVYMAEKMDRLSAFGWDGWEVLAEYLWDLAESTGEPEELDIIELCGLYVRYRDRKEAIEKLYIEPEELEEYLIIEEEDFVICRTYA